jgi:hypothetical protein
MPSSTRKRGALLGAALGTGATLALVVGLGLFAGAGAASSSAKPVNTSPPTISGTAQQGQTLTGNKGVWSNSPTDYNYFWTRCNKSGDSCSSIGSAHNTTYVLASADVGRTIRFKVTAENADGSTSASSAATATVTAAASLPHNTSPPTIKGTPQEGQTLSGNRGNWTGNPSDFNDSWMRCDKTGGSCANISGATNKNAYVLTSVDVGNTIRFRVDAKNASGTTSATSVPTAVIVAATKPPPANGCPTGTGAINVANIGSPARLLIDQQQPSPPVVNRGTNQLIVRYHVSACGGRSVQGALVYATAVPFNQLSIPPEQQTNSNGWAELDFHMLAGFPVSSKQQLIAIFTRARKSGEDLLGGISTRRLFSVPVNLNG